MNKRVKHNIKIKKTLFIFCEWETELSYFDCLREAKRDSVNIKIETRKFKSIKEIFSTLKRDWFSKKDLNENRKIFLILDADIFDKSKIDSLKKECKNNKIELLFSNLDIEFFILLHLEYYNWGNKDYIKRIKKHYNDYEKWYKNQDFFKNLINNNLENLEKNFEKINNFHNEIWNKHIKDKAPFSEVYYIYNEFK